MKIHEFKEGDIFITFIDSPFTIQDGYLYQWVSTMGIEHWNGMGYKYNDVMDMDFRYATEEEIQAIKEERYYKFIRNH